MATKRLRPKIHFVCDFNLIWAVQPQPQRYFYLRKSEYMEYIAHPVLGKRGVRVVTNVELGMRWTRAMSTDERQSFGRRSRVVPIPRRWDQALRDELQGDGGYQARYTREITYKP
jgi:hypothetical protein